MAGVLAASALLPVTASTAATADGTTDPTAPTAPTDPTLPTMPAVTTPLTLASFNVLGSSHTRHSKRFATGVVRMRGVVKLLERHAVEVVGFQELQANQLTSFLARTGGQYDVYPGFALRRMDTDNSIAWDTLRWQALEETTLTIPYFNGRLRPMPVVKLRNLATGMTAWFANFHNPATNRKHRHQEVWRAQALQLEIALARQLRHTGLPVFFTGDFNDRAAAFCPMVSQAPMRAARGGSYRFGVCDPKRPWYVDWIFGIRRQRFSGYLEDASRLVKRTTDHPVIVARVDIDPAKFPAATVPDSELPPAPTPDPLPTTDPTPLG